MKSSGSNKDVASSETDAANTLERTEMPLPVFPENCDSLLKKHLTEATWKALADKKTASGFTFQQAIRSGVEQPDSSVGIYAGDEESYHLFASVINPIIQDYHGSAGPHCKTDFSLHTLPAVTSLAEARVQSTRIRVGRNLDGFPLGAAISREQRLEVEKRICDALTKLPETIQGQYHTLSSMTSEQQQDLVARHLLFKSEDRFMTSGNLMRDWPEGRGLFLSTDESFSVWVNEEDQLRIISLKQGGDIKSVFALLAAGISALSEKVNFLFSNELGYLASCPTNLGTSMRASVHMSLSNLGKDEAYLKQQADILGLQVRGLHGEHSESEGSTYDISNPMRLGISETAALAHLIKGINHLAELDERTLS
jgi:creatine kinase/arginine kinase